MSIFDAIGKQTFNVIRAFDGRPATWKPLNDATEINKIVLYKNPTQKLELGQNDFSLERFAMEYYETDFPGLYESVSDANNETVIIEVSEGVLQTFIVKRCEKKYDGKSILAILTPIEA